MMKSIGIYLMTIVVILLLTMATGCISQQEEGTENQTATQPTENVTTGEGSTFINESTPEGSGEVNNKTGDVGLKNPETTVYLDDYSLMPKNVTVSVGGTVYFFHNQNQPNPHFTLVSEEGLWEPVTLSYGQIFSHTFVEPGVYHYHVVGYGESMKGSVQVVSDK